MYPLQIAVNRSGCKNVFTRLLFASTLSVLTLPLYSQPFESIDLSIIGLSEASVIGISEKCPSWTGNTLMKNAYPVAGNNTSVVPLAVSDAIPMQAVTVRLYISKDQNLSSDDQILAEAPVAPSNFYELESPIDDEHYSAFSHAAFSWYDLFIDDNPFESEDALARINMDAYEPGVYYLIHVIDPLNEIEETNEENNVSLFPEVLVISNFTGGDCNCCPQTISDNDGNTWELDPEESGIVQYVEDDGAFFDDGDSYFARCRYERGNRIADIGEIYWHDDAPFIKEYVGPGLFDFCSLEEPIHDVRSDLALLGRYDSRDFPRATMEANNRILADAFADRAAPRYKVCLEFCEDPPPPDSIEVSSQSIMFDYRCKDVRQTKTVLINYTGTEEITTEFTIDANGLGDFSLSDSEWTFFGTGGFTLEVSYEPKSWKYEEFTSTLFIRHGVNTIEIPITVRGSQNRFRTIPGDLTFIPDLDGLDSKQILLELENPSGDPIVVERIKVLQSGSKYSTRNGTSVNNCIDDDIPRVVHIDYDSNQAGDSDAILEIEHSGTGENPIALLLHPDQLINELLIVDLDLQLSPDVNGKASDLVAMSNRYSDRPFITISHIILESNAFEVTGGTDAWVDFTILGTSLTKINIDYDVSRGNDLTADLIIHHDGANSPLVVKLSVPDDGTANFICEPEKLEYTFLKKDESDELSFVLKNTGSNEGSLEYVEIPNSNFTVVSPPQIASNNNGQDTDPIEVLPGDSIKFRVNFEPKEIIIDEIGEELKIFTSNGMKEVKLIVPCSKSMVLPESSQYEFNATLDNPAEKIISLAQSSEEGGDDPVIITEIYVEDGFNFELKEKLQLPLYLEDGENVNLIVVGEPTLSMDGESIFKDDALTIKYNDPGSCAGETKIFLRAIGNPSAALHSIEPARSSYGQEQEVVILGSGFANVVEIQFIKGNVEESIINIETKSRERIEATVPLDLNPGVYDLRIVARDGSHDTLRLPEAYTIYTSISGTVYNMEINLTTGVDRPPLPLPNAEVIIRESEFGDRLGSMVTGPDGKFEVEIDRFRDFMWVEASILPTNSKYTIPALLQSLEIQPFVKSSDYKLSLPLALVNDIHEKLLRLEKLDVTYNLPLLSPIVVKKITGSAYDINPIRSAMAAENLFENRFSEQWKIESLKRIDLALLSTKEHMDLVSTLSPEMSSSFTKALFQLVELFSKTTTLHDDVVEDLKKIGAEDVQNNSELLKDLLALEAMDRSLQAMLKVMSDFIKREVDRSVFSSLPNTPQATTWKNAWNKSFVLIQKQILSGKFNAGPGKIAEAVLQDAVVVAIDQAFRLAYFYAGDATIKHISTLSASGAGTIENFNIEASRYTRQINETISAVHSTIELAKNLDESGGYLKDIGAIGKSIAPLIVLTSGGTLSVVAAQILAAGEALQKLSMANTFGIPILLASRMILTHNSLSNSIADFGSNPNSIPVNTLISQDRMVALQELVDESMTTIHSTLATDPGDKKHLQVEINDMLLRIEQAWRNILDVCNDNRCGQIEGDLQQIKKTLFKVMLSDSDTDLDKFALTDILENLKIDLKTAFVNSTVDQALDYKNYTSIISPEVVKENTDFVASMYFSLEDDIDPSRFSFEVNSELEIQNIQWVQNKYGWQANITLKTAELRGTNWISVSDARGQLPDQIELILLSPMRLSLEIEDQEPAFLLIYPNPGNSTVKILTRDNIGTKSLTIYNSIGQKVTALTITKAIQSISVTALDPGTYIMQLISEQDIALTQFIKSM